MRAGGPVPEIRPLMKTFVSRTRRDRAEPLGMPVFSDALYGLGNGALDFFGGDAAICELHFGNRLPGIDVPQRPPDDEGLGENPADRVACLEGFLGDFFVKA